MWKVNLGQSPVFWLILIFKNLIFAQSASKLCFGFQSSRSGFPCYRKTLICAPSLDRVTVINHFIKKIIQCDCFCHFFAFSFDFNLWSVWDVWIIHRKNARCFFSVKSEWVHWIFKKLWNFLRSADFESFFFACLSRLVRLKLEFSDSSSFNERSNSSVIIVKLSKNFLWIWNCFSHSSRHQQKDTAWNFPQSLGKIFVCTLLWLIFQIMRKRSRKRFAN